MGVSYFLPSLALAIAMVPGQVANVVDPSVGETIRVGTTNATTTGSYDSQYTTTWDAGTYALGSGEVVVTAGVGVFDGLQTAGTYTCGNRTVVVSATVYACATSSEWHTFTNVTAGTKYGWTIVIRVGMDSGSMAKTLITRTDCHILISGDSHGTEWPTANYMFNDVTLDNPSYLTIENCSFKSLNAQSDSAYNGGHIKRLILLGNHMGENDPDTNADYSAGYTPTNTNNPFKVTATPSSGTTSVKGLVAVGNTFRGAGSGDLALWWFQHWAIIVGNHYDKYYNDGAKFRSDATPDAPFIFGGDVFTRPFSLSTDAGSPHSDSHQVQGCVSVGGTFEFLLYPRGDTRGKTSAAGYIQDSVNFKGQARGLGAIEKGFYAMRHGNSDGFDVSYVGGLPEDTWTGTLSNDRMRVAIDGDVGSGTMENCFGAITVSANITVGTGADANVSTTAYTDTTLDTVLPNWGLTATRPTQADGHNAFLPATGEALEGKGPTAIAGVSDGVAVSSYQDYTMSVTSPTLSSTSASSTTTLLSGSSTTDVAKGWMKWAVVPAAMISDITDADWKHLAMETIEQYNRDTAYSDDALYYFDTAESTATAHVLSETVSLSAGDYYLVSMHMNGWAQRSSINKQAFTVV